MNYLSGATQIAYIDRIPHHYLGHHQHVSGYRLQLAILQPSVDVTHPALRQRHELHDMPVPGSNADVLRPEPLLSLLRWTSRGSMRQSNARSPVGWIPIDAVRVLLCGYIGTGVVLQLWVLSQEAQVSELQL